VTLAGLNALSEEAAIAGLLRCCASTRWARMMTAARPFASVERMTATADAIWASLSAADWLEAFRHHPRIGESDGGRWSSEEQAEASSASLSVRERLAAANRDYEARFGYIFIVCAAGRRADEILTRLEDRLTNAADAELLVAAEEQRRITRLRLAKLLEGEKVSAT
jgi:2-oxo-4-hydroxy-4-carboxy-5-ureidoimidazoline decarboxylase